MSGLYVHSITLRYASGGGITTTALQFDAGKIIALLGPNGAGKSSLIKAIVGVSAAKVEGLSLSGQTLDDPKTRARALAYLSQSRTGPASVRVRDVIRLGRFPYGGQDTDNRVDAVITRLGLVDLTDRPFGRLSGGEQARVLLARALAVDAPVLLADEPTASLDPYYALRIMDALRAEAQRGRTVIVSLHDLTLAERYCDDALILDGGSVVGHGPIGATLSDAILRDTFRVERSPSGLIPIA